MSNPVLDNLIGTILERNKEVQSGFKDFNKLVDDNMLMSKHKSMKISFPTDILILGCGGTGSWLLPKLIKILNDASNKNLISKTTSVILCDGDEIEEKNLIRQNFVAQDVSKNKAQVMCERYGSHLNSNINVGYVPNFLVDENYEIPEEFSDRFTRIEELDMFKNMLDHASLTSHDKLIINLIDNGKTRKLIHNFACNKSKSKHVNINVLDVANNEYNGQLNLSPYGITNPTAYSSLFYNRHPSHLADDEDISVFSCADADAEVADQLFNANDMAATIAGNYINAWIVDKKLSFGEVQFVTGLSPKVYSEVPLYDFTLVSKGPAAFDNNSKRIVSRLDGFKKANKNKLVHLMDSIYEYMEFDNDEISSLFFKHLDSFNDIEEGGEGYQLGLSLLNSLTKIFVEGTSSSGYLGDIRHAMSNKSA